MIELPDELTRHLKAAAASRGMKLEEFVAHLHKACIAGEFQAARPPRILPEMIQPKGRSIPNRSNSEWMELVDSERSVNE